MLHNGLTFTKSPACKSQGFVHFDEIDIYKRITV